MKVETEGNLDVAVSDWYRYFLQCQVGTESGFRIRIFFADPDPGKNLHADPDPDPGGIRGRGWG